MSSLSTNFRIERLLRDSQRQNIQLAAPKDAGGMDENGGKIAPSAPQQQQQLEGVWSPRSITAASTMPTTVQQRAPEPSATASSSSSMVPSSASTINGTMPSSSHHPQPPPSFPHQFPSGTFPFGLLPHPLPFLSPPPLPFPHIHHQHPHPHPSLNSFLASAAAALLQQQYQAALLQHFMASSTPIFNGATSNSASTTATTAFGSGGGGGSAGTAAAPSTHGLRAHLHPFVAASSLAGNGQTPRRRIKKEPAAGGANRQRANVATCEICGKSFGRPWLLNGHRRIHDGEKPYRCEWAGCGRAFADPSNCRAHERTHHPEKPHACHHCGKAFKLKSYLAKHVRANHMRANVC